MRKKISWLFVALVIIVIALGAWIGALMFGSSSSSSATGPSSYAAVYLSTGDIYYGKLSWFPSPHLTDVWYLQKGGANGTQFGIAPFTSAFWGPINEVYLNPNQIIFWTYLRNNSEIAEALSNPVLLQQLLSGTASPQQATSSFTGPTTSPPGVSK
jgi:hypothetical protein